MEENLIMKQFFKNPKFLVIVFMFISIAQVIINLGPTILGGGGD